MSAVQTLLDLLDLETLDDDLFQAVSRDDGFRQVFGGQVVAQALVAAGRTVAAERVAHSLHAYFIRPGDYQQPIFYQVDRTRDGGSFTTRRVQALQNGKPIFSMMASFHVAEDGWDHQPAPPAVASPESLVSGGDRYRQWLASDRSESPGFLELQEIAERVGVEFRPTAAQADASGLPSQQLWLRCAGTVPQGRFLHACVLAYISDFMLLGTAKMAHGSHFHEPGSMTASLDHALWLHRDLRLDDWLLYRMDSPSAHAARGFTRGEIFDRAGRLVASVAQEGLIRRSQSRT